MGYTWTRMSFESSSYAAGVQLVASIPNGQTYRRIRWSWGFGADTPDTVDMGSIRTNHLVLGVVTTIGNTGETVPAPVTTPVDVSPPRERWLWWEARQPVITAVDHAAGVITWRDSGSQEIPDIQVPVLATGMAAGDTLNLWVSWQALFRGWPATGEADVWASLSVLIKAP